MKLSIMDANKLINKANEEVMANKSYRFGQALWNSLPKELIECGVGTERDFFYWEDRSGILRAFYTNFVEEGDKPNYDTSVVPDVDYKALFEELLEVTENSDGVTGLHLNGDTATWDELENNNWLPLLKEWKESQHE